MQTELLLATITNESGDQPSFLEVYVMEQMERMVKPAIRHISNFVAESLQFAFLVEEFDNIYTLCFAWVQWYFLSSTRSASITERLYGLERVQNDNLERQGSTRTHSSELSDLQKVLSLVHIVVVPRLVTLLSNYLTRARDRAEQRHIERSQDVIVPVEEDSTSDHTDESGYIERRWPSTDSWSDEEIEVLPSVSPPTNTAENYSSLSMKDSGFSLHSTMVYIANLYQDCADRCVIATADIFPFTVCLGESSAMLFKLLYLCGVSQYHDPILALLGIKLIKRPQRTSPQFQTTTNHSSNSSSSGNVSTNLYLPMAVAVVAVVAIRIAEWLRNSNNSDVKHLTDRLATPIPLPPAPVPAKVGKGCLLPATDHNVCALCNQERKNACACSSGYVFCYMCLLPYIREQRRCPITGVPCNENDIIRLYEDEL